MMSRVMPGRLSLPPPKSLNMFSNAGMTKVSSTVITPPAITMTMLGYTIAPRT
jgi:hypothetical protein